MTALVWDDVGERLYETGVDKCVLFLSEDVAVAWNGVTSIEEQANRQSESLYLDGVKFLERQIPGDYAGVLNAYTYPQEFDAVLGTQEVFSGLYFHDQPATPFSLVYRTRIGNDVDGPEYAYKLHILYSVIAIPDTRNYQTLGDLPTPTDFSWQLKTVPQSITGYRPVTHISVDSRSDPERFAAVERLLYGTDEDDPELPDIDDFVALFDTYNDLTIVDNGDGTWTALDPGEHFITMLDATTFSIDDADVVILDADTYEISNTDLDD